MQPAFSQDSPWEAVDDIRCTSSSSDHHPFTFTWEKDGVICLENEAALSACPSSESLTRVQPAQMSHHLFPASDAGHALECDKAHPGAQSMDAFFEDFSWFPFDLLLSQRADNLATTMLQPTTIPPTDTFINPPPVTYSSQEATVMDQWTTELPYVFDVDQQSLQPYGYLEEFNQNALGTDFNLPDMSPIGSPTTSLYTVPSSSQDLLFLHSPFSSPCSSVLSHSDSPSFSPEMELVSLFPHLPVNLADGAPLIYLT